MYISIKHYSATYYFQWNLSLSSLLKSKWKRWLAHERYSNGIRNWSHWLIFLSRRTSAEPQRLTNSPLTSCKTYQQHHRIDIRYILYLTENKVFIKDFFSKCDQIRSFLWIWSHSLRKSITENFMFCTVLKHSFLEIYHKKWNMSH